MINPILPVTRQRINVSIEILGSRIFCKSVLVLRKLLVCSFLFPPSQEAVELYEWEGFMKSLWLRPLQGLHHQLTGLLVLPGFPTYE